jgi:hypothetical protein
METLDQQFESLENTVREVLGLLQESDGQKYWLLMFRRSLPHIEARELAGATLVLGCFGGENTFSDLTLNQSFKNNQALHLKNLNARLDGLRNKLFETANRIASRELW